jgi:PAS domain S-box-containing protein
MMDYEVLFRWLMKEKCARLMAEEISEKKIAELYRVNRQLKNALQQQKKVSNQLTARTIELEEQMALTEEERNAKSTLQSILQSTIEYSIIALNLQGVIMFWNEGAKHNYGFNAEEMVHRQNIRVLHTPEDVASGRVQEFMDLAYQVGKAEGDFERVRKDNSRFTASVYLNLRRNDIGIPTGYVMVSKDVTESKLMEEQLIKTNQELEQFAYVASHDLKAPLRAIERLSSWIEEDNMDKLDPKSQENLRLLRQRTNRMSNLIDGILQYSRAGRVDLDVHEVDSNELVKEVIDSLNPSKKIKIFYKNLPVLPAAKVPLSQVFANLISNSIKHHERPTGTIEIGSHDKGRYYEFYVKDNGPGIEKEYFDKIFVIFQTLKSRDELEATGIGLSIVKKIVESQGGKIRVESELGKGSTFFFTWPKFPRRKN